MPDAMQVPAPPNPILVVPSAKLRPPVGVQEIGNQGSGNMAVLVSPLDWKLFSYKSDAQALLALLQSDLGITAEVIVDGEEESRFIFSQGNDPNVGPRVYDIYGTDAQGNVFWETVGDVLNRRVQPESQDVGKPYKPGDVLVPKINAS